MIRIVVPDGVPFADLALERRANGDVAFDWTPIETICAASGLDVAVLRRGDEDALSEFLIRWYAGHLAQGGERDAIADELWAEALSELN